jgi:peptidoglycan-N-acetylglucosamine deacetylase
MRVFGRTMILAAALLTQAGFVSAQFLETAPPEPLPQKLAPPAPKAVAKVAPLDQLEPGTRSTVTVPLPAGCDNRPSAIGLSRIVEIDTTGGPRFGHSQYKDVDFLQDGEVVLTFDDGPMRHYTKRILDTLDAHCTRGTFFSVGKMALADPETLKETARRGHTVASHTWAHAKLSALSPAKATAEIEMGNSAVTRAMGGPIAPFFRFPYLRDNKAALDHLKTRNMSTFSIEVDSQDFRTRNPGQVLRNVMSQLKTAKKGIILFHDIQPATAGALSSILDNLKAGGFKVVHLVSKQTNTTLPEFDALVEREIEKKRLALASQPLGNPAAAPASSGARSKPGEDAAKSKAKPAKPVQPAAARDDLPWSAKVGPPEASEPPAVEAPAPPPPRKAKPLWYGIDDDPWRIRTLGD